MKETLLRKIYGPDYKMEKCQIRYKHELYQLYKTLNALRITEIARLGWVEYFRRTSDSKMPGRVTGCKPER